MHIRRINAVQAHPIPMNRRSMNAASPSPRDIFDPALLEEPKESQEVVPQPGDPGHVEFPPGASVANGMTGTPLFRCNYCEVVIAESEIEAHQC